MDFRVRVKGWSWRDGKAAGGKALGLEKGCSVIKAVEMKLF